MQLTFLAVVVVVVEQTIDKIETLFIQIGLHIIVSKRFRNTSGKYDKCRHFQAIT